MGNRSNLWIGSFPRKDGRHFSREEIEDELEKKEGFVLRSMGGESLPSLSIWDIAPDDNAAVMDWVQSKLPAFQPLHDNKFAIDKNPPDCVDESQTSQLSPTTAGPPNDLVNLMKAPKYLTAKCASSTLGKELLDVQSALEKDGLHSEKFLRGAKIDVLLAKCDKRLWTRSHQSDIHCAPG